MSLRPSKRERRTAVLYVTFVGVLAALALAVACGSGAGSGGPTVGRGGPAGGAEGDRPPREQAPPGVKLVGRAVLPAATFAEGPPSGRYLGEEQINGQSLPFDGQPVQGFSSLIDGGDGTFLALADNGYGTLESSADFNLRIYTIRPSFEGEAPASRTVEVVSHVELRDPDRHLPFTIVNDLTDERVLTGADLDPESFVRGADGTFWIGDEFGPFLVHVAADGRVLAPPVEVPDPSGESMLRSPQSPLSEEASAVRVLAALRAHARAHEGSGSPVASPDHRLLVDGDEATGLPSRAAGEEGYPPPSSEIIDVESLHRAGFEVVPGVVNDPARMRALIAMGVDGLVTDRPDLLRRELESYDPDGDGSPDLLDDDGLLDRSRFDAVGHRGARGLRPENTLPAFEAALDHLVTTLELDVGLTEGDDPVVFHDLRLESTKCRRPRGRTYTDDQEHLVREMTEWGIRRYFVCDVTQEDFSDQTTEPGASPVTAAFARARRIPAPYAVPTLAEVFEFVEFYGAYYGSGGAGRSHEAAAPRAANAARVRLTVDLQRHPVNQDQTADAETLVRATRAVVERAGLEARVNVQSLDWNTLLEVQTRAPALGTVYPFVEANLECEPGERGPWLGGLIWPWRVTSSTHPFQVQPSGGFEGLAAIPDGSRMLAMVEKPLVGDESGALFIYDLDTEGASFTGNLYRYQLGQGSTSIGELVMTGETTGLVIERDDSEGNLDGFKGIYAVTFGEAGMPVERSLVVDLMRIDDPAGLSAPIAEGDVGLGATFAFPFFTIESLVVLGDGRLLVANDNNFPLSVGRHRGSGRPDDTELILLELP